MPSVILCRRWSASLITLGTTLSLSGLYSAYLIATRLSIPIQVGGHLLLIIGPALFKLGYVLRLAAEDAELSKHNVERQTHAAPLITSP
ncbi:hypothetical protein KSF73_16135 [Burkholderiaceae bacterium DAT-1]|nr:hypothetical protein [Burkholderiaceae bacterium DAT-1]